MKTLPYHWRKMLIVLSCSIFPTLGFAAPSVEISYEMQQPNGNSLMLINKGDEWNNWTETEAGYSVAKSSSGYWYYVDSYSADGAPIMSGTLAEDTPPEGQLLSSAPLMARPIGAPGADEDLAMAPTGDFNGPVLFILAEFNDQIGTTTESAWGGFVTNNIVDYFSKASYGQVNLTPANETFGTVNNGVVGWVTLNSNHPNTGSNTGAANRQLTKDAIIAADAFVDFSVYDANLDGFVDADELAIVVVVAGFERAYSSTAPSVWGHKWSIFSAPPVVDGVKVADYHSGAGGYAQFGEIHLDHQATMGIMVHELGHLIFGLPDLYDIDSSSAGIGYFGVMGSGSWGAATGTEAGEMPVMPSAWTRYNRGWADGAEGAATESITAAGDASANSSNSVYRASTNVNSEYFLVENRQLDGYDQGFERWFGNSFGGLLIWHIDDTQTANANDAQRWVDLEEADGTQVNAGSASDAWYAGNATVFDDTTTPNSKQYNGAASGVDINSISAAGTVMTATFGAAPGVPEITTPVPGSTLTSATEVFSWVDNGATVAQYQLDIGSTVGGTDIFSQNIGTSITQSVAGLPTDGSSVYARLSYNIAGTWTLYDYVYTAATINIPGDFDTDSDIDLDDINLMKAVFGTNAVGANDPYDMNNDGVINVLDFRMVIRLCTRTRCSI
ncbi:MAG: hypothetical protein methR_P3836 [Methyloprofundus sp.]|nr:MAG: hypothetical protein methR_P3836 [Methyloprofundus sp.]